ncbi:MAG: hypothetical protein FJY99_12780 [Candidatus Sericytochromatia bacterium]|nr:hypothetical protein [Candidatus Tanganyikabacteria bacterium]
MNVLSWVAGRDGARMTEIRGAFGLSPWMAGALVVQLQDAGWLNDPVLGTCHHLGPEADAGSCGNCSGGGCSSQQKVSDVHDELGGSALAFEQGCCGMNQPYRVTDAGLAMVRAAGPIDPPSPLAHAPAPASAESLADAWVARAKTKANAKASLFRGGDN